MPKTREQKKEIVRDLNEKIKKSKSIVFINFNGLNVKENEELRKTLRKQGGEYLTTKKTLLNLALKDNKFDKIDCDKFEGQLATVFSYEDEVAPVKTIDQFIKDHKEKINFLGGILENKILSFNEILELAKIPSKLELKAKLVGTLNAPISGFVNVLAGNLKSLVYVLKAIEEKKS